jgi:hypothetical protein
MAVTPSTVVRVEPALIREAAERAGLSPRATVAEIIRYALAVVAGKPDPHEVALVRPGPKRRSGAAV